MAWDYYSDDDYRDDYRPWTHPVVMPKTVRKPKPFPKRTETMTATATAIDNFEKTVKQHAAKKVGDVAELLEQIKIVKTATPPVYEESQIKVFLVQRAKALNVLIDNFLVAKLSSQYPLIDNKLFSFKRHIYLKDGVIVEDSTAAIKAQAVHVEIPLFIHTDMNSKRIELEKFRKTTNQQQITTVLSSAVPVPPTEVAELGRKALGFYHGLLADIYNNPNTSDLFAQEASPTLETMWIPTVSSINVKVDVQNIPKPKRYDPALLMKHRDRYYLVGMWEIKEELPFEGILREFTVGPVQFPKKN